MGFGQLARGQILRGILYLAFELIFIAYMVLFGWKYLVKLGSLGEVAVVSKVDPETGLTFNTYIDNSMLILLYGLLTVFFIVAFIYVWRQNCIQNGEAQKLSELGFRLDSARDDIRAMADKQ
jgi:arabinogalactan oligomer/maltooligosaccharide transport system permease protein